jgi:hypothetical protein
MAIMGGKPYKNLLKKKAVAWLPDSKDQINFSVRLLSEI